MKTLNLNTVLRRLGLGLIASGLMVSIYPIVSKAHDPAPPRQRPMPVAVDRMNVVEQDAPTGSDPLSPREIGQARVIVEQQDAHKRRKELARQQQRKRTIGLNDVQFLYAERHDEGKDGAPDVRRAALYYFDYSENSTIRQLVNLRTQRVDLTEVLPGYRAPPTTAENVAAVQIVLDHPQLGKALRRMNRELRGIEPESARDITSQSGIHVADFADGPLAEITAACRRQRCVQLLLPQDDNRFIDTGNLIVNLSTGQVYWMNEGLTVFIDNRPLRFVDNVLIPVELGQND